MKFLSPWVASLFLLLGTAVRSEEKPNFLFLISDDQCFDTIGALGLTDIETPNLDRLVRRGTTFTHAYNMGGWHGAICVASRTMLNTGHHLWRAQTTEKQLPAERAAGRFWSQRLAAAGYQTYMTGKWHLPIPPESVFQTARLPRPGMPKDGPRAYNRPLPGKADTWDPADPSLGGFWAGGKHWTEVTADVAVEFLGTAARETAPFFMYVAFNAPHDPRQAPAEFVARYPPSRMALPGNFLPLYPYHTAIGCGPDLRDEKLVPFPRTEQAIQVQRGEYYAQITHLDAQIGRVLEALEATGKADNTWIFFTSDHGLAVGQHGLIGKQNMYEHSLRVPFLAVGPGAQPGRRITTPIYLQDVMPTTLDLAGLPREGIDYRSLRPALHGEVEAIRRPDLYGAYMDLQRAVIHDGWKLIAYPKVPVLRLYHLAVDPSERVDLAGDAAHAARRRDLFQRLLALQRDLQDPLDLTQAFPAP
jgi:choline-sulfatase